MLIFCSLHLRFQSIYSECLTCRAGGWQPLAAVTASSAEPDPWCAAPGWCRGWQRALAVSQQVPCPSSPGAACLPPGLPMVAVAGQQYRRCTACSAVQFPFSSLFKEVKPPRCIFCILRCQSKMKCFGQKRKVAEKIGSNGEGEENMFTPW